MTEAGEWQRVKMEVWHISMKYTKMIPKEMSTKEKKKTRYASKHTK